MKGKVIALITVAIALLACGKWCEECEECGVCEGDLIITIANGRLRGKDNGHYYSYESIPYAEPPVGELRFEAPQPYHQIWNSEFNATRKPQPCMQWNQYGEGENKLTGVEDCLTVNIYKPKTGRSKYPVMVFLYGGCFMFGDVNLYSEDLLMKNGRMMLIKVAYRVGPFGFLSTQDNVIPGNFGLKDQQLALEWIKNNIAQFGGDPEKIMLTGFSAGAASAHLQLLNPKLQGIAKTAVAFSGVALNPWVITKNARENAFKLAKLLKCPHAQGSQDIKKCLQSQNAEDIVTSVKYFMNFGYNPFTTFGPVVEDKSAPHAFMTQHPRDIISSGNFSHIPFLVTYAKDDGGYNAAELLAINPKTGREYIYDLNDHWLALAPKNLFLVNVHDRPQEYARTLRRKYLGEKGFSVSNYPKVQDMYTDILFKNGVVETLKLHRMNSQVPVYACVFGIPAEHGLGHILSSKEDFDFGATHMDDIYLIFKFPDEGPQRINKDAAISEKLINMLVNFAEHTNLSFGDCEFVSNRGASEDLTILSITRDECMATAVY